MAKNNNFWLWIGAFVVVALALGWISIPSGIFSSGDDGVSELYPSDLKTTITLNTGDALSTTATATTVNYYVFDSAGKYLKEGTTSSGTASFTVPTGGNYKMIIYYDATAGGGTSDYLPQVVEFSTDGDNPEGRALQTVNVDLYKESAATINSLRDPVDLDSNITASAGAAVHFDVLISATTAYAALNKPVVLMTVNSSAWQDIDMNSLSSVDCPDRVSTVSGYQDYCFKYDSMLTSGEGIKMFTGTLYADAALAPASNSKLNATILDTGMYIEPDYKTKGFEAFKYGTENPLNNAEVGAADSSVSQLTVD